MTWRADEARVLVVERARDARAVDVLSDEGFAIVVARDDIEAMDSHMAFNPGLVLIEVDHVTLGVRRLCAELRAVTRAPIALLSNHYAEQDAVAALSAGADTFVAQPVGSHELVARVRALLRRAPLLDSVPLDTIVVGPVSLDRARRELKVYGEAVPVPRREFDIAELLMRKAGVVVTRDELVRELWGSARDTKSLDVQVGRLRARLSAAEGRQRILTIRGVGFRFVVDADLDPGVDSLSGGTSAGLQAGIVQA